MAGRFLRDSILTSKRVDALSAPAEVFYRRLISVVDDYGRVEADPLLLRVWCFPLRVDRTREADIVRWLTECETADLIALYVVDGKKYLQLHRLGEPRAKKSKCPPPPNLRASESICAQMKANVTDAPPSSSITTSPSVTTSPPPNPPKGGEGIPDKSAKSRRLRGTLGQKLVQARGGS